MLPKQASECFHQGDITDDIYHLALSAKSWCSGLPAAAMRKIATTTMPEITVRDPAIQTLTVARNAIAPMVAMQGGNTFQANTVAREER